MEQNTTKDQGNDHLFLQDQKIGKYIFIFATFLFVISTGFLLNTTNYIEKIFMLDKGISICFGRIQQSFITAKIGGFDSNLINQNFAEITQQCFGDVVEGNKNLSFKSSQEIIDESSVLATEVYWFNRLLLSDEKTEGEDESEDLGQKYSKIENQKYLLVDLYQNEIDLLMKKRFYSLFISIISILTLAVVAYAQKRRRLNVLNELHNIDILAKRELEKKDPVHIMKLTELMKMSLFKIGSINTFKLFQKHNEYLLENVMNAKTENDQQMEKTVFNLSYEIKNAIKIHKDKIFAKGIMIDMLIPEKLDCHSVNDCQKDFFNMVFGELIERFDDYGNKGTLIIKVIDDELMGTRGRLKLVAEYKGKIISDDERRLEEMLKKFQEKYKEFIVVNDFYENENVLFSVDLNFAKEGDKLIFEEQRSAN